MKDKLIVCEYYVCTGQDCNKGMHEVTMKKCQKCKKYSARKTGNPDIESVNKKRNKIRDNESKKMIREY